MISMEFDILVLGGGSTGASILYQLSLRGFQNIALVDAGRTTTSATANSGGMLRVFHEHPEHLDLALASARHILRLQESGVLSEQVQANGSLYFFNKRRYPDYQNHLKCMEASEYPFEILTPVIGRRRFPLFHWSDAEWAVYEPRGSALSPRRFVEDLLHSSQGMGATVIDDFEVTRVCRYRDHYRVNGPRGVLLAKNLILAGGAKTLSRLNDLGLKIDLEAKTLRAFTSAANLDSNFDVGSLPNFFDRESLEFAKLGSRVVVSTENVTRVRVPFWQKPMTSISAEDAYAPNRIGFAGEIAGHPKLSVAAGWGGTGFKFALEIGMRVANSIQNANTRQIGAWSGGHAI